tara:strand:- start:420 stop:2516 length:2097 start_codon:yes stop_codon:yes gene_type:complete
MKTLNQIQLKHIRRSRGKRKKKNTKREKYKRKKTKKTKRKVKRKSKKSQKRKKKKSKKKNRRVKAGGIDELVEEVQTRRGKKKEKMESKKFKSWKNEKPYQLGNMKDGPKTKLAKGFIRKQFGELRGAKITEFRCPKCGKFSVRYAFSGLGISPNYYYYCDNEDCRSFLGAAGKAEPIAQWGFNKVRGWVGDMINPFGDSSTATQAANHLSNTQAENADELARADIDNNGTLSRQEMDAFEKRTGIDLDQFNDGDDHLSRDELRTAQQSLNYTAADADHDGFVSTDEMNTWNNDHPNQKLKEDYRQNTNDQHVLSDAGSDGRVTREQARAYDSGHPDQGGRAMEAFKRHDGPNNNNSEINIGTEFARDGTVATGESHWATHTGRTVNPPTNPSSTSEPPRTGRDSLIQTTERTNIDPHNDVVGAWSDYNSATSSAALAGIGALGASGATALAYQKLSDKILHHPLDVIGDTIMYVPRAIGGAFDSFVGLFISDHANHSIFNSGHPLPTWEQMNHFKEGNHLSSDGIDYFKTHYGIDLSVFDTDGSTHIEMEEFNNAIENIKGTALLQEYYSSNTNFNREEFMEWVNEHHNGEMSDGQLNNFWPETRTISGESDYEQFMITHHAYDSGSVIYDSSGPDFTSANLSESMREYGPEAYQKIPTSYKNILGQGLALEGARRVKNKIVQKKEEEEMKKSLQKI